MAWMGRPPFLLSESNTQFVVAFGCQCPEWSDLHFYVLQEISYCLKSCLCQCPEWGDLHFYWLGTLKGTQEDILCQCPEWGDLHFYAYLKLRKTSKRRSCVNALNGATSISTKTLLSEISETQNVSMPWKGRPPFLHGNCSCMWARTGVCVNALKGATSISTLASGNPHK